jgi:hypothetical protein
METAKTGEVLELPAGPCPAEVTVANPAAFTLEGAADGGTVLEPTGSGKSIVQSAADVQFTLSGLTFTGTREAQAIALSGAGEAVTLSDDTFANDLDASGYGAGVSIQLPAASTATAPTRIIDDTFSGDSAAGGAGFALLGSSPLLVEGSSFTADGATAGGGLVVAGHDGGAGAVRLTGNTFGGPDAGEGDTAAWVGGGAEVTLQPSQTLTLVGNRFEHDRIAGAQATQERVGAGLFVSAAPGEASYPVTQSDDVFADNAIEATQKLPTPRLAAGGAGEWITGLAVQSTADRFTGNRVASDDGQPPEGGALGAFASATQGSTPAQPGVFTGVDDLFTGNSTAAGGWGGAIYVGGPPPDCSGGACPASGLALLDSTVVANSVDAGAGSEGGAIWGSPNDSLALSNSILYGNSPQPEIFGFTANAPTFAYSDVCNQSGGPAVAGAGNICANPLLNPDGSETRASPTIDAGSGALVPAGLATDIAGTPRILASRGGCHGAEPAIVDMGAFEFAGPSLFAPSCPAPGIACADARVESLVARLPSTARVDAMSCPGLISNPRLALLIQRGPLVARHGAVKVTITCEFAASYCAGTVTLRTTRAFASAAARGNRRRARKAAVTLGSASLRIAAGRIGVVKIHLRPAALARLGARRTVSVLIAVRARDSSGASASASRTSRLRLRATQRH